MPSPEVSVVIPTFNAARFLAQAIDSVLAQTFRDIEVLVIDDGSTDGTPELMRRYGPPVRYVRQENRGVAHARNRGIEQSSGAYVAFLDADDTWRPRKLERQREALAAAPGRRAAHTAFAVMRDGVETRVVRRDPLGGTLDQLLTIGNVVGTPSSVICARSVLDQSGGFDPAFSQCADWEMWIRVAAATEFAYVDEALVEYRQHSDNMSRDPRLLETDSVRALQKGFSLPHLTENQRARKHAAMGRNYRVLAGSYFRARRPLSFLRCAARALLLDPRQIAYMLRFPRRRAEERRETSA